MLGVQLWYHELCECDGASKNLIEVVTFGEWKAFRHLLNELNYR